MPVWTPNQGKKCLIVKDLVNLLTAALKSNNQGKLFIIWSDTKSKWKETTLLCLENFYKLFTTENSNLENIIYRDGPNSEFKVSYMSLSKYHLVVYLKGVLGSMYFNYCEELLFW